MIRPSTATTPTTTTKVYTNCVVFYILQIGLPGTSQLSWHKVKHTKKTEKKKLSFEISIVLPLGNVGLSFTKSPLVWFPLKVVPAEASGHLAMKILPPRGQRAGRWLNAADVFVQPANPGRKIFLWRQFNRTLKRPLRGNTFFSGDFFSAYFDRITKQVCVCDHHVPHLLCGLEPLLSHSEFGLLLARRCRLL